LLTRLQAIAHTVGDIEGILESLGTDDGVPEDTIRELVLAAFEEQDVEEQTRSYEEAIRRAQEEFSAQEAVVDETLGDLSDMHSAGPTVPKLDQVSPRWDPPTFVRTALAEEGAQVVVKPDGRWRVHRPGFGPITITFDEVTVADAGGGFVPVFGGKTVEFFGPGSPGFERLVGTWAERASHRVLDARGALIADPIEVGRGWAKTFGVPVTVVDVRVSARTERFSGSVSLWADANVKHDRVERLYKLKVGAPPDLTAATDRLVQHVDAPIGPTTLPESDRDAMVQGVQDQSAFRSFGTFYRARRTEEVAKAPSPAAKEVVQRDFTPFANATVQGLRGVLHECVDVDVEYVIETSEPYRSKLRVEAGSILEQPQRAKCSASGALVPVEVLAPCAVSGRKVMRHLLVASEVSGELALPEHTTTCAVSGVRLLYAEGVKSSVSGRVAAPDFTGTCPVTGKTAILDELVECEFTGVKVVPDALGTSEVSGKRARVDELVPSSASGIKGHRSEFMTCEETGLPLLPHEGATTAIDGRFVRRDMLAASAKDPRRLGLRRDIVTCAVSGKRLLPDEVVASAVSGKRADPALLVRSDVSGRLTECWTPAAP
ncbi:MAG: hypothetical protein LC667_08925, partial [Thioalkalivibrio sp.]|nr:hypothetical protein [Thioalkalivibrio sp.]